MESNLVTVTEKTKYKDLIGYWKKNGRAYAVPDKDVIIEFIFRKRK